MRMFMVETGILCEYHLKAEHDFIHEYAKTCKRKTTLKGRKDEVEPQKLKSRHDELVEEMLYRGIEHNSPFKQPDFTAYKISNFKVSISKSVKFLIGNCPQCNKRFSKMMGDALAEAMQQKEEDKIRKEEEKADCKIINITGPQQIH